MTGLSFTIPVALSVLGVVLICISGWLGGQMVFKHGVAVDTGTALAPDRTRTDTKIRAA